MWEKPIDPKRALGFWVRNRAELLLIASRGDFPPPDPQRRPPSIIEAPRGIHSAKPAAVYKAIEDAWPDLKRVELFSREKREGWDVCNGRFE